MPKATIELSNGTLVTIEGTTEEVSKLLQIYENKKSSKGKETSKTPPERKRQSKPPSSGNSKSKDGSTDTPDLSAIVNSVKDSSEAEIIENQILDRTSQVDRILLPLYIIHEYHENEHGLTSGEISKILTELGIPISQPNTSTNLSKTASRYVIGDKVRVKGHPVRYKLSRRGLLYMKKVLEES